METYGAPMYDGMNFAHCAAALLKLDIPLKEYMIGLRFVPLHLKISWCVQLFWLRVDPMSNDRL